MSADSCHTSCFKTSYTSTNDNYILLSICWFDRNSSFVSIFCIEYTRDVTTARDCIYTTFITCETFTNWFILFNLNSDVWITAKGTSISDDISITICKDFFTICNCKYTTYCCYWDRNSFFYFDTGWKCPVICLSSHWRNCISHISCMVSLSNLNHFYASCFKSLCEFDTFCFY